MGHHL